MHLYKPFKYTMIDLALAARSIISAAIGGCNVRSLPKTFQSYILYLTVHPSIVLISGFVYDDTVTAATKSCIKL
jgi:hypothetical protein